MQGIGAYFVSISCSAPSHSKKVVFIRSLTPDNYHAHPRDDWKVTDSYLDRETGFRSVHYNPFDNAEAVLDGNEVVGRGDDARKRYQFKCKLCDLTVSVRTEALHPVLWKLTQLAEPVEITPRFRHDSFRRYNGPIYLYTIDLKNLAAIL